jgi:hypothetical protein
MSDHRFFCLYTHVIVVRARSNCELCRCALLLGDRFVPTHDVFNNHLSS